MILEHSQRTMSNAFEIDVSEYNASNGVDKETYFIPSIHSPCQLWIISLDTCKNILNYQNQQELLSGGGRVTYIGNICKPTGFGDC